MNNKGQALVEFIIIMPVMIFILIISCTVINKKTVKNKAFDYAKTLLEVCDSL